MQLEKRSIGKGILSLTLSAVLGAFAATSALAEDWPMFLKTQSHAPIAERAPSPPYSLKWKFAAKGPIYSSPVVSGNTVLVGSDDKNLYALDAATGKTLWSYQTGGEILSTPAVSGKKVFFGSKDGNVYALDADTGKLVWKYETEGGVMSSAVVAEGNVFIASMDLYLYAINAETGKRSWRMKLPDYELYSGIYSSPAYSDGSVYIAGKNGAIYSFDAKSGGRNWWKRTRSAIYSSPAIEGGRVYIASYDRTIYALDAKTGKFAWRKSLGNDIVYATPVVYRDRLYVGFKSGYLKAYSKLDGSELAAWKFPSEINSTPVVSGNGTILVGCEDGHLYAVDAETGSKTWSYATNGGVHSSPAVANGTVYIGSEDGSLYAFEAKR